jgi:signal transduction histidine kinase/CheY-like chemotaxis protein
MTRSAHEIAQMTQSGLNLIKQAISIYDADLKLAIANQRFQDMFDLPDDLVELGKPFADCIHYLATKGDYGVVGDIDTFVEERVEQAKAFQPHYIERDRANGTRISIEGSPLRQGGWVTVYTDITDIKNHEAVLRARSKDLSQQLLKRSEELSQINREFTASVTALEQTKRELIESELRMTLTNSMIPAHIARVDVNGCYTYTNQKLDTVIPNRPKNILGKHIKQALGTEAYEEVGPRFQDALNGHSSAFEFALKDSGKQVRVAFTPDTNDDGNVIGAYLLSMDITEEANARRALTHARRRELAAQLTSGMAHDFSNLLTIILGQQNKLESIESLPEDVKEIVKTTKAAALRGGALLNGLSQLTAKRTLTPSAIDFSDLINGLNRLGNATLPAAIDLIIDNQVGSERVILDQGFTQDALLNLILNAREAINGAGTISVTARRVENWLDLIVRDTGSGFTKDAIKNVFTPFYTTKKGPAGRGLGLTTVFDFAKISGGRVDVKNHKDGGAIVSLRIPYIATIPIDPGLILLVEDNEDIRQTIRDYLRIMGHSVLETNSAEEALKLSSIPGLTHIITDLMLEGEMTGYDLAKQLQNNGVKLPITIITGLPEEDQLRSKATKSFTVLHKPFSETQLATVFQKNTAQ